MAGSDLGAPSRWGTTGAIAALAAAVRAVYAALMWNQPFFSDAAQYHELANHLADGTGFASQFPQFEVHSTAWRPPLLPFVLSGFYRVFGGSETTGRLVALGIGVVLVAVCHRVFRRHLGDRVATIAAVLVACYPPLVANDTVPLTESLSLILVVLLGDAVVRRNWALSGALFGLLVLARPSAQAVVVVLVPLLIVSVGWRRAAGGLLVAALVVTPWVVRNQWELGLPGVVSSNGFNLAALYSSEAQDANAFIDPLFHSGFDDMRLTQFDEADWDATLRRRALDGLRERPGYVAVVAFRNVTAMTEVRPSLTEEADRLDGRNPTVRLLTRPLVWLVTVVGLVGVWRARRNRFVLALAAIVAVFVLGNVLLLAWPRLRAPLDLLCCLGVAVVADAGARRWGKQDLAEPAAIAGRADAHLASGGT